MCVCTVGQHGFSHDHPDYQVYCKQVDLEAIELRKFTIPNHNGSGPSVRVTDCRWCCPCRGPGVLSYSNISPGVKGAQSNRK